MGRPRKYVHDNKGRLVDGVSDHPRGGFYIINREGQREYFGKGPDALGRARQRHLDSVMPGSGRLGRRSAREVDQTVFTEQALQMHPEIWRRIVQQLESWGLVSPSPPNMAGAYAETLKPNEEEDRTHSRRAQALDLANPTPFGSRYVQEEEEDEAPPATGPKLGDCLRVWRQWKSDEVRGAKHIKTVYGHFQEFVKVVGNRPIAALDAEDFITWQKWVLRNSRKRNSGKWASDWHSRVKAVFTTVRRKKPSWLFPQGVMEWADSYERRAYTADRRNREPMPVGRLVLHGLVTTRHGSVICRSCWHPRAQHPRCNAYAPEPDASMASSVTLSCVLL